MVLTFDPHPVKILAPHVNPMFLTSPEEKLARFEAAEIDEVVFLNFTSAFAALIRCSLRHTCCGMGLGRGALRRGTFCVWKRPSWTYRGSV